MYSQLRKIRTTCKYWNMDKSRACWTQFQHHSYYDNCLIY